MTAWRPVPVRSVGMLIIRTGEWKCVAADVETFDLGSESSMRIEACRVYHRSRKASERHCATLPRRSSE